tara:strand:- start:630 stop:2054 length:1425 start_codon:yes stop_codon:yes gene_type:complete
METKNIHQKNKKKNLISFLTQKIKFPSFLKFTLAVALLIIFSLSAIAEGVTFEGDKLNLTDDLIVGNALFVDATNGKVGINTQNPEYFLDVRKTGDRLARFGSSLGNHLSIDAAGGQGLVSLVAGAEPYTNGTNKYYFTGTRGASKIMMHDGNLLFFTSDEGSGTRGELAHGLNGGDQKMQLNRKGVFYVKGPVGIGTKNPKFQLDVAKTGDDVLHFGYNTGNDFTMDIAAGQGLVSLNAGAKPNPNGTSNYVFTGTRGASRIQLHDGYLGFYTSNSATGVRNTVARGLEPGKPKMAIDKDGRVGIGANPLFYLDVRKTGDSVANFGSSLGNNLAIDVAGGQGLVNLVAGAKASGSNYVYTGTRGASRIRLHDTFIDFFVASPETRVKGNKVSGLNKAIMVLNNQGNVGIGTKTPKSKLHVDGYIQMDEVSEQPPEEDCDANNERGRMKIDSSSNMVWICNGADRGWDSISLDD